MSFSSGCRNHDGCTPYDALVPCLPFLDDDEGDEGDDFPEIDDRKKLIMSLRACGAPEKPMTAGVVKLVVLQELKDRG